MKNNKLLNVTVSELSKKNILEKIKLGYLDNPRFLHIVSLNPENLVVAQSDFEFKKILNEAEMKINDGVGIVVASSLLGIKHSERVTGVELMEELLDLGGSMRLSMLLIGGSPNLAEHIAECYSQAYPGSNIRGIEGISLIDKPTQKELDVIHSIVTSMRPRFVFVSFGSPAQEKWIEANRELFKGSICMGVGGAFDFLGSNVSRAPRFMRKLGLEWLFRLIKQPWRVYRQRRLLVFIWLVLLQWIQSIKYR